MSQSVLARMAVMISANTAELNKGLKDVSGQLKGFGSQLNNIAGTIGVAFGVQQVLQFGLEVSKLAGEAEAVQAAFDRLPNSIKLMNQLKQATGGTVSELELMKRAVQASNFDISLEALPRLLEFATLRAQQTGQSVDYLVDSIVTGIGRKSKLILDNLGISAAQLSEELKGVSTDAASVGDVADAVGRIAEKNLVNMAGFSENASTKLQRLAASWDNLKVAIGNAANGSGIFGSAIDALGNTIDVFSSDNISNLQKFQTYLIATFAPQHLAEFTKALKDADAEINKVNADLQEQKTTQIREDASLLVFLFGGVKEAVEGFRKEYQNLNNIDVSKLSDTQIRTFSNFDEVMKVLQARLKELIPQQVNAIDTIAEYKEEIKKLTAQNENLTISEAKQIQNNGVLIRQYQEEIDKLQELSKAQLKVRSELPAPVPIGIPQTSQSTELPNRVGIEGTGIQATLDAARAAAAEVREIQIDLQSSTADFISNIAESIGQSISGTYNFGKAFLLSLANFGQQFGRQLVALGIAQIALKASFKNPYAAIAAGAALIIASSAIAGSVRSFNSGVGSGNVSGGSGSGISDITRTSVNANTQNIQVSGEFVLRGSDLVASLNSAQQSNYYRRG